MGDLTSPPPGLARRSLDALRRRGVLRAAGGYLVLAWLAMQVADVVLPAVGLPDGAITVLLIVLAVGFPIVIVVSWMFDLRGLGLVRDYGPDAEAEAATPKPSTPVAAVPADRTSIAILPFRDLSPDKDQEHLAFGLAEELANALGGTEGLRVVAQSSATHWSQGLDDAVEIGRQLGVGTVVEGSVRKSAHRLRTSARLVEVGTGYTVFSESFDSTDDDIFAIQDEISGLLAEALRMKLLGSEGSTDAGTEDSEAYDLYLRGRHYWNRRYAVGLGTALEYFEKAAEADPTFALPLTGIADTHSIMAMYGFPTKPDVRGLAMQAVAKARSLAPDRAEVFFSDGLTRLVFDGDWAASEQAFEAAVVRRPNFGQAWGWLGLCQVAYGRPSEGSRSLAEAYELEPHSKYVPGLVGYGCLWLGWFEEAQAAVNPLLEENPESVIALSVLSIAYGGRGELDRARSSVEKALALTGGGALLRAMAAWIESAAGNEAAAAQHAEPLLDPIEAHAVAPVPHAIALAAVGRELEAVATLRHAHRTHGPGAAAVHRYPFWNALHPLPGWAEFMKEIGVVTEDDGSPVNASPSARREFSQRTGLRA